MASTDPTHAAEVRDRHSSGVEGCRKVDIERFADEHGAVHHTRAIIDRPDPRIRSVPKTAIEALGAVVSAREELVLSQRGRVRRVRSQCRPTSLRGVVGSGGLRICLCVKEAVVIR